MKRPTAARASLLEVADAIGARPSASAAEAEVRRRVASVLRARARVKDDVAVPPLALLSYEAAPHLAVLAREVAELKTRVNGRLVEQVARELRLRASMATAVCQGGHCAWRFGLTT